MLFRSESPSPFLTPELRQEMGEKAVAAARAVNYSGAGTIEVLRQSAPREPKWVDWRRQGTIK